MTHLTFTAQAFVKAAIYTNRDFARWALAVVYAGQTEDERESLTTYWQNGCGFSAADARFLSNIASNEVVSTEVLPAQEWQLRLSKYAAQIVRVVMVACE
jgi:hypothetical protein